jgi:purine-nucleoside phosphorylase
MRLPILAVEMEAAALYAFATATSCKVLCLAHVTNTMLKAAQTSKRARTTAMWMHWRCWAAS